jgi:hypothetical protein
MKMVSPETIRWARARLAERVQLILDDPHSFGSVAEIQECWAALFKVGVDLGVDMAKLVGSEGNADEIQRLYGLLCTDRAEIDQELIEILYPLAANMPEQTPKPEPAQPPELELLVAADGPFTLREAGKPVADMLSPKQQRRLDKLIAREKTPGKIKPRRMAKLIAKAMRTA